jgi:hypothetical protein
MTGERTVEVFVLLYEIIFYSPRFLFAPQLHRAVSYQVGNGDSLTGLKFGESIKSKVDSCTMKSSDDHLAK